MMPAWELLRKGTTENSTIQRLKVKLTTTDTNYAAIDAFSHD
jgi:hypothetical protein